MNTPHVVNAIVNVILIAVPCAYILYSLGTIIYFLGRQRGYKDDCDFVRKYQRDLDELYRACQAQRDAAQAGVVAAHIERDRAVAELHELVAVNVKYLDQNSRLSRRANEAESAIQKADTERCSLEGQVARLIEENGKLIAELSGSIKYTALAPMWSAAHALKSAITEAERTIPLEAGMAPQGCPDCGGIGFGCYCDGPDDFDDETVDDDDDKPSGEVEVVYHDSDDDEGNQ